MSTDSRAANLDSLIAELADLAPEQQAQVRMFIRQLLSECDRSSSGRGSEASMSSTVEMKNGTSRLGRTLNGMGG